MSDADPRPAPRRTVTYVTNLTPSLIVLLVVIVCATCAESYYFISHYGQFARHRGLPMRLVFIGLPVVISLAPSVVGFIMVAMNVGTVIKLEEEAVEIDRGRGDSLAGELSIPWSELKVRIYLFGPLSVMELAQAGHGNRHWRIYALCCPNFEALRREVTGRVYDAAHSLARTAGEEMRMLKASAANSIDLSFKRASDRQSSGFTLIELMIVMFIIGILVALMLPNFRHAVAQSDLSACQQNLKTVAVGLQTYSNENSDMFPSALSSLTPTYLAVIPTCPSIGSNTYTAGYTHVSTPDQSFTVTCNGTNHGDVSLSVNQPYYTMTAGLGP